MSEKNTSGTPIRLQPSRAVFPPTYISSTSKNVLTIVSSDSKNVQHYEWRRYASEEKEEKALVRIESLGPSARQLLSNFRLFSSNQLKISPIKNEIWPLGSQMIVAEFKPRTPRLEKVTAYLYNVETKKRIPYTFECEGIPASAEFNIDQINIGHISLDKRYEYKIFLKNTGNIPLDFILLKKTVQSHLSIELSPEEGHLEVEESAPIIIKLDAQYVGQFNETFEYKVISSIPKENDEENIYKEIDDDYCEEEDINSLIYDDAMSRQGPSISIYGRVIGPAFDISKKKIDFGTVSYGFLYTQTFEIQNKSEIPLDYNFRLLPDKSYESREFKIDPNTGSIPKNSTQVFEVNFIPISIQDYNVRLIMDSEKFPEKLASIIITATCVCPDIMIKEPIIDLGPIFYKHTIQTQITFYNSTKYASKFEFVDDSDDQSRLEATVTLGKFTGIINPNGDSVVPVYVTPLQLGYLTISRYVRIFGSDEQPLKFTFKCLCTGPNIKMSLPEQESNEEKTIKDNVSVSSKKTHKTDQKTNDGVISIINFGSIPVLEQNETILEVFNDSLISAPFHVELENSSKSPNAFSISISDGEFQPGEKINFPIKAFLNDSLTFNGKLIFSFKLLTPIVVNIKAKGKGSSIVSSIDMKTIDMGFVFSGCPVYKYFELRNHGKRSQEVKWQNNQVAKPKIEHTIPNDPPKFRYSIEPLDTIIQPDQVIQYTIKFDSVSSCQFEINPICEAIVDKSKNELFKPLIKGHFIKPALQFDQDHISFNYVHDTEREEELTNDMNAKTVISPSVELLQPMIVDNTVTNVSELPLDVSASISPPFYLSQEEFIIQPNETIPLQIIFKTDFKKDFTSQTIDRKVTFSIKNNPKEFFINVKGSMIFPNLALSPNSLDFGSILRNTEYSKVVNLRNSGSVPVEYFWELLPSKDDTPKRINRIEEEEEINETKDNKKSFGKIFDAYPIRGRLDVGESADTHINFCAMVSDKGESNHEGLAICHVVGGPDYTINLKGSSCLIDYTLGPKIIDFGVRYFAEPLSSSFSLSNSSDIVLDYQVKIPKRCVFSEISIEPLSGNLEPGKSQIFTINLIPGFPTGIINEPFFIQVGEVEESQLTIKVNCQFPQITSNMPRLKETDPPTLFIEKEIEEKELQLQLLEQQQKEEREQKEREKEEMEEEQKEKGGEEQQPEEKEKTEEKDEKQNEKTEKEENKKETKDNKKEEEKKKDEQKETDKKEEEKPKEGEQKEGETKEGETKEGETKEGETKEGEQKEGETKEGETKEGEQKEGETNEEEQQAEEKEPEKKISVVRLQAEKNLSELLIKAEGTIFSNRLKSISKSAAQYRAFLRKMAILPNSNSPASTNLLSNSYSGFVLSKYAVNFGKITIGESKTLEYEIRSITDYPISFSIQTQTLEGTGFEIEPTTFTDITKETPIKITISFDSAKRTISQTATGEEEHEVPVIFSTDLASLLVLQITIMNPTITLSKSLFDFGITFLGQSRTMTLQVSNSIKIPVEFTVGEPILAANEEQQAPSKKKKAKKKEHPENNLVVATPKTGNLPPASFQNIEIMFSPSNEKEYNIIVPIYVKHSKDVITFNVVGVGYQMKVIFDKSSLDFGQVKPFEVNEDALSDAFQEAVNKTGIECIGNFLGYPTAEIEMTNPCDYPITVFSPQFDLTIMNQVIQYQFDEITEKEGTKVPPESLPVEKSKKDNSARKGSSLSSRSKSHPNSPQQQQHPSLLRTPSNLTNVSKFSICVIVNGPPMSGKSTMSKYISQYLGGIPIVSLKEIWKDLLPPEPIPEPEPEPIPEPAPTKAKPKANAKGKASNAKGKGNAKGKKGEEPEEKKEEEPAPPPPAEETTNPPETTIDANVEVEKPEPIIVTDEMLISAFIEATSKGDCVHGFVIDGLDVFKEPPETELLIQSTFKNKKIVDELSKNPFTVVPPYVPEGQSPPPKNQKQQEPQSPQEQQQQNDQTSAERALSLILQGLTGQYVFQVAIQATEEAIHKHEEMHEKECQQEKEEKDKQELERILEMDEETYSKLTEEEKEAVDKKRQEHRAKILEESGITLEDPADANPPPGKGGKNAKNAKNAKKGQSRLSTTSRASKRGKSPQPKKPPPKKGAAKPTVLSESVQNGMIIFNITLGRITNQLQDVTNTKFQAIDPVILKGSRSAEAVQNLNSLLLDSNNEIEFLQNQISEFLPELKDIKEKALTQLMPQEKVILPTFFTKEEVPHLYEAPKHFNIVTIEKPGDFPVLKRYEKPQPPLDGTTTMSKNAKKNKIITDNTLTADLDIYKYSRRWHLEPKQSEKLKIQFIANEIGAFEDSLLFCVENCRNDVFKFQVLGTCMYPDFDRSPRSIFKDTKFVPQLNSNPNSKKIESDIYIEESGEYYFGPLIVAGKDRGKKDPFLYSKKVYLTNNSPFDCEITATVFRTSSDTLLEAQKATMNATNSTTNTQRGSKKKDNSDNSNIWGFEQNKVSIPTGETGELGVCLHPVMPDTYYCTIEIFIKDNPEPFYLKFMAEASSPTLEVSTTHLDFGRILLKHEKKLDIILKNPLKIPSFWRFKNPQAIGNTFTFSETEGTVNPRSQVKVHVTFSSSKTIAVKKQLQLDVLDKMKQKTYVVHHINVNSEAFDLPFEFLYPKGSDHLDYGTMRIGQAKTITCTLKNKGKYPSSYAVTYAKPKYKQFLTVTEMGSFLQPSDKPLNINFVFCATNKQCKFEHTKYLTVTFYEPEENTEVGSFDVFVTGSCFFSEYEISPDKAIDFGSTSVGETISKELVITNKGMFSFEYEIVPKVVEIAEPSSQGSSLSKAAPRRKNSARGSASRQGSGQIQIESNAKRPKNKKEVQAGNFFISPLPSGTIQPGNSVTLKVDYFDNESRSSESTIFVRISDVSPKDPAYYNFNKNKNANKGRTSKNTSNSRQQQQRSPSKATVTTTTTTNAANNNLISIINNEKDNREGKPILLTGKTFMPGINTKDIEKIFPGQPLCLRYDLQKNNTNAFLEDDQLFHFSPNILNTPQSVDISLKNQFPVPCVVDASVKPIQKRNRRQTSSHHNQNFPFELSAVSIAIPPLNESNLKLTFNPKTEGEFSGMFEATVRGGTDPNSRLLKFGVEGTGTLPKVKLAEDYGPVISFGRTLINTRKEKKVCIQNDGLIPARIKFSVVQQNENPDAVKNLNGIVQPPSADSGSKNNARTSKNSTANIKRSSTTSSTNSEKNSVNNDTKNTKGKTSDKASINNDNKSISSQSTTTILTEPASTHSMFPPEFRLEKVDLTHEFVIEPKRSLLFTVRFAPTDLKKSEFTLLITVLDNEKSNLKLNFAGEGFQEDIVIEGLPNDDNKLIFNDVVVYRPCIKTFYMHNVCEDDARFEWVDNHHVTFSPKLGHLKHGKTKKITATFSCDNPLSYEDLEIICKWSKIRYLDENVNSVPDWDDTMKHVTFIQRGELISKLQMAQMAQLQLSQNQSRNQNSRIKHNRNSSSDSSKLTNLPINGFNFTYNDIRDIISNLNLNLAGINDNGGNLKSRTLLSGRKFPPKKPQPPNRSRDSNLNSRDSSRIGKGGNGGTTTPRRKSKNLNSVTNLMNSMSSVSTMTSSGSISLPPLNNGDTNAPDPMTELVKLSGTKPEPAHEFLPGHCKDITLFVTSVCDFIKYEIVSPESKEISFSPTMMYDTRVSEVEIKNVSSIRFDYTWVTNKYESLRGGSEFTSSHSSPFSVLPKTGFIAAGESQTFQFRFSPIEVDDFTSYLWMDIPYLEQQMQNLQQQVYTPKQGTSKEQMREQQQILESLQDYPEIYVSGYSQRPLVHFDVDLSDYITAGRRHPDYSYPVPDDIRVIELFSSGIGKTSCKKIIVINPTSNPYEITWTNDTEHSSPVITCDSTRALVSSGKKYTISFSFKPTSLKAVESLWNFSIPEYGVDIPFLIVGKIMPH